MIGFYSESSLIRHNWDVSSMVDSDVGGIMRFEHSTLHIIRF